MTKEREQVLVEGGLESACFKAGKIFAQGGFVTRRVFEELVADSLKLTYDFYPTCPSILYVEYDATNYLFRAVVEIAAYKGYCYRCSFRLEIPGGKHAGSAPITTNIAIEEWKSDKPIDFIPDHFG